MKHWPFPAPGGIWAIVLLPWLRGLKWAVCSGVGGGAFENNYSIVWRFILFLASKSKKLPLQKWKGTNKTVSKKAVLFLIITCGFIFIEGLLVELQDVPWLLRQISTKQDKVGRLPGAPQKQVMLWIQRGFMSDPYRVSFIKQGEL